MPPPRRSETDAQSSECATYYNNAACADDLVQPDASAANCIAGNTFLDRARNMAKLFCSP